MGTSPVNRRVVTDAALAVLITVLEVVGSHFAGHDQHDHRTLDGFAFALLVIGPLSLALRRRAPLPVLAVVFATVLAYRLADYPMGPVWLSLVLAFVTVVIAGYRSVAVVTIVAGYFLLLWLPSIVGAEQAPALGFALGVAAWLLVLLAVGEILRVRRERARAAEHAREEELARRASEERLRIARELHDVLAHNISLINIQAGVALHLIDEQPEQGRAALEAIKAESKDALRELRSVLGVLRRVDEDMPREPAPGVRRLDELTDRAVTAGARVRTEVEGEPRTLPAGVDLAAYRIVQEALTNVTRHAGAADVTVRLAYGARVLTVSVDDDGSGAAPPWPTPGGNGIVGMRERAASLGGELEAGPLPAGGFRVLARLPLDGAP